MEEKPADWNPHFEWPFDQRRRVVLKILGNPNPVVQALGLDILLPDPDSPDVGQWNENPGGWKTPLRGRIAGPLEEGSDTEWALLMAPVWGRIWFDLEEGVIVYFQVERMDEAMSLLETLDAHDVPFSFPNGQSRVRLMPGSLAYDTPEVVQRIEATGFVANQRRDAWIPPRCVDGEIKANRSASAAGWMG
jgi:hypothetical protein